MILVEKITMKVRPPITKRRVNVQGKPVPGRFLKSIPPSMAVFQPLGVINGLEERQGKVSRGRVPGIEGFVNKDEVLWKSESIQGVDGTVRCLFSDCQP